MSLDRLIDLAKRTGDRLIVHDPICGRDIVIMGIEAYERLLDDELLDNRRETMVYGNEDFDVHEPNDIHSPRFGTWDSVGDIISERYRGEDGYMDFEITDEERDREEERAEIEREIEQKKIEWENEKTGKFNEASSNGVIINDINDKNTSGSDNDTKSKDVPLGEPLPPDLPADEAGEPIFYEEPIV